MNENTMRREGGEKTHMPVQMALMIARDERAVRSFDKLGEERKLEYIRRAQKATDAAQMRQVVRDIITIG